MDNFSASNLSFRVFVQSPYLLKNSSEIKYPLKFPLIIFLNIGVEKRRIISQIRKEKTSACIRGKP